MILVAHPSAEEDCHVMTMVGLGFTLVRLHRECGDYRSVQQRRYEQYSVGDGRQSTDCRDQGQRGFRDVGFNQRDFGNIS
jgi:hypothetical protein